MDTWESYNTINDIELKNSLGECMVEGFKSITFTFLNATKIISQIEENIIQDEEEVEPQTKKKDNKKGSSPAKKGKANDSPAKKAKTGDSPEKKANQESPESPKKIKGKSTTSLNKATVDKSKDTTSKAKIINSKANLVVADKGKTTDKSQANLVSADKGKSTNKLTDKNLQQSVSKATVSKEKPGTKKAPPSKGKIDETPEFRDPAKIDPVVATNEYYTEEDYYYYHKDNIKPFVNLIENLKEYSIKIEALSRDIFQNLAVDLKQHALLKNKASESYTKYFLGKIDDLIMEREEIMKPKRLSEQTHKDMTQFKRHYDAVSLVMGDIINEESKVSHERTI